MGRVEKSVTLNVPVEDCYRLWTDMEDYPRFMHHLKKVVRHNQSNRYHWVYQAEPSEPMVEWDVEMDLTEPNRLISWKTLGTEGPQQSAVVLFHDLGNDMTRVEMIVNYTSNILGEFIDDLDRNPQRVVAEILAAFVDLAERRTPYHRTSAGSD